MKAANACTLQMPPPNPTGSLPASTVRFTSRSIPPGGGQFGFAHSPARAPHGRTCGEPGGSKTDTHPNNITALFREQVTADEEHRRHRQAQTERNLQDSVHRQAQTTPAPNAKSPAAATPQSTPAPDSKSPLAAAAPDRSPGLAAGLQGSGGEDPRIEYVEQHRLVES